MLKKDKNKMNLKILGMLREKGAPALTPFPGEQDFETTDTDLDELGDVLVAGNVDEKKAEQERRKKRKNRQEDPTDFVPADENIQIGGVN